MLKMDALELIIKGLIVFILSSTTLVILSIPLSVYRIIDYGLLGGTVLLIVGVIMIGVYLFAKRAK